MSESENNLYQYSRELVIFMYSRAALISYAFISRETMAYTITNLLVELGIRKYSETQVDSEED